MSPFQSRLAPHLPGAPTVAFHNVSVRYDGVVALDNVSFHLSEGEHVAVVGPNGAGKSTLFNVIVGKVRPTRGEVQIYGSGPKGHICIGYVPQRNAIDWRFPVTVRDVVMMGRTSKIGFLRWAGRQDHELVEKALVDVRIDHLADRQIGELSGGQQQRVFLARAMAQEAQLLLLDEPFTGLDAPSQQILLEILEELHGRRITILVATHDLNQAAERFGRIMLLNRQLVADGAPEEVLTADLLRRAYGSHLHVIPGLEGGLVVADTCCDHGDVLEMERV
ncbi:ATP-binding cassette domain-containing protein [bacterium]|nr:ATP-binding cassette domain-containing protein [bacterium]